MNNETRRMLPEDGERWCRGDIR